MQLVLLLLQCPYSIAYYLNGWHSGPSTPQNCFYHYQYEEFSFLLPIVLLTLPHLLRLLAVLPDAQLITIHQYHLHFLILIIVIVLLVLVIILFVIDPPPLDLFTNFIILHHPLQVPPLPILLPILLHPRHPRHPHPLHPLPPHPLHPPHTHYHIHTHHHHPLPLLPPPPSHHPLHLLH